MNSKERVLTSLMHKEPDRVPILNTFTPEVGRELSKIFGVEGLDLDLKLGHDCLVFSIGIVTSFSSDFTRDSFTDRWGITWKRVKNAYGYYMEIDESPLKKIEDIYSYKFPMLEEEPFYNDLKTVCSNYGNNMAIIGGEVSIFEHSSWLRGYQNLLEDIALKEDATIYLLDKVADYNLKLGLKIIDAGVDILNASDDFGMQTGLLISYNTWKELFYPRWKRLFQEFKKRNPDIKIAYHSDGFIIPLIDDLIEAGVDILNPIQPDCMEPSLLKKRYGKRLSFWGTVDVQHTFSFGTPADVANEVKERLRNVAPGGGLILGSTHNIQMSENAIGNVLKFYEVVKNYGGYPIKINDLNI